MLGLAMEAGAHPQTRATPRETECSLKAPRREIADSGLRRESAVEERTAFGRNLIPKPKQEPELGAPVEKEKGKGKEKELEVPIKRTPMAEVALLELLPLMTPIKETGRLLGRKIVLLASST